MAPRRGSADPPETTTVTSQERQRHLIRQRTSSRRSSKSSAEANNNIMSPSCTDAGRNGYIKFDHVVKGNNSGDAATTTTAAASSLLHEHDETTPTLQLPRMLSVSVPKQVDQPVGLTLGYLGGNDGSSKHANSRCRSKRELIILQSSRHMMSSRSLSTSGGSSSAVCGVILSSLGR